MLAVRQAQKLIKQANISGIDDVYAFNLPLSITDNVDSTVILITDANTTPEIWASNDFHGLKREVEIQVFYKQDLDVDPEVIESKLYRLFVDNDWDLGENRGHTYDPDTNQITTSFYVYNLKIKGGN